MTITAPDAFTGPAPLGHAHDWVAAEVPGTAALALKAAGRFDADAPQTLHDKDIWFVTTFKSSDKGARTLVLEGIATIAEVFWNGVKVLASDNMFLEHLVDVELENENQLAICCRALAPHLQKKGPRARWRPQLATSQGLRLVRTTLLGHMPGWCPEIHAVGPYRSVYLVDKVSPQLQGVRIRSDYTREGFGELSVAFTADTGHETPVLVCAGASAVMERTQEGMWQAYLSLPEVRPWMPHTHGEPALYRVYVSLGDHKFDLGQTGFRRIAVETGQDGNGFGLRVNNVPVFCRGAVWTNADVLGLKSDRQTYRAQLELARDAGMNMLRIGGTMLYEAPSFFEICDELGILVWQDFQFANYDYPVKDAAFVESVNTETTQQLSKLQGRPSLAVLCGGSEIYQQGAMMGLPEDRWKGPLFEEILPAVVSQYCPDVAYVANSPMEGALPFLPGEGIAHYYGVGAYQRPLEDVRRAEVRFAAECLAFSNVPSAGFLEKQLPVRPGHDPRWKTGVPRDRGVGWDFEDVRDHYLKMLYGVEPQKLRYEDPDRYLDLSRVVTGDIMEAVFSEWRRAGSPCQGGLVWTFQDVRAGAGWGVVDAAGEPKPAYYALKRAFRPLALTMTDEGTNGLMIHVVNDHAEAFKLELSLSCLREGRMQVAGGKRVVDVPTRGSLSFFATDLIGAFFDVNYAYRFGPLSHDVTVARLVDPRTGTTLADAVHFTANRLRPNEAPQLLGSLVSSGEGMFVLEVETDRFAQSVEVMAEGHLASDNWFHLAPGVRKTLTFSPLCGAQGLHSVRLKPLNGSAPVSITHDGSG
ncbi:glycoside hydrolase family 2 protein [Roseibium hamelinense]|nr:glycoside hydrolase family 2 protein [Roseibium hamelinense]